MAVTKHSEFCLISAVLAVLLVGTVDSVRLKLEIRGPGPGVIHRTRLALSEGHPRELVRTVRQQHPEWMRDAIPERLTREDGESLGPEPLIREGDKLVIWLSHAPGRVQQTVPSGQAMAASGRAAPGGPGSVVDRKTWSEEGLPELDTLLKLALEAVRRDPPDYPRAESVLQRMLLAAVGHRSEWRVHFNLAQIYRWSEKYDASARAAERSLALGCPCVEALITAAECLKFDGATVEASSYYLKLWRQVHASWEPQLGSQPPAEKVPFERELLPL